MWSSLKKCCRALASTGTTIIVAELGEVLIDPYELLEMWALFNSRDESQLLQVLLEDFLPLINQSIPIRYGRLFLAGPQHLLGELNRRLRKLDVRILIDQFLVQQAERLVFLAHYPLFLVECNVNHILCILPIVNGIIVYPGWFDGEREWDLEEERPCEAVVFAARFHVLHEDLCREEDLTEFALHGLWVLEYTLIDLNLAKLLL